MASVTVAQMREYLKGMFSERFISRVDKMSDKQVTAIYFRIINKKK